MGLGDRSSSVWSESAAISMASDEGGNDSRI